MPPSGDAPKKAGAKKGVGKKKKDAGADVQQALPRAAIQIIYSFISAYIEFPVLPS